MGSGGLTDLAGRIGGSSGLSGRAVISLLGLLAPIVLGVLKREKHSRGLDSIGLSELLAGQRSNITAAMPESMLGRGEPLREVARETYRVPRTGRTETYTERAEPARHSWLSWILPLALLAGLIGLVWNLASRPPKTSVLPSTTVHAGREPVREVPQTGTPASFERLKTKYQSVINEAQAQGVEISNLHEQNGKLVIKGTAPSVAAATSVWNEIRRVNPKQDDIIADFRVDASRAPSSEPADSRMPGIPAVPQSDSGTFAESGAETYTVKAGDTLGAISNQFYGTPGDYMRIFNANRDQLMDRDQIEVGQVLTIPR
jgi:nucleoid-associated protein YgaU